LIVDKSNGGNASIRAHIQPLSAIIGPADEAESVHGFGIEMLGPRELRDELDRGQQDQQPQAAGQGDVERLDAGVAGAARAHVQGRAVQGEFTDRRSRLSIDYAICLRGLDAQRQAGRSSAAGECALGDRGEAGDCPDNHERHCNPQEDSHDANGHVGLLLSP
jgi:hypothetical protein